MGYRMRLSCLGYTAVVLWLSLVFAAKAEASETVLFNFAPSTGAKPYGRLIIDSSGDLYGTTFMGGAFGAGTIFKLTYSGGNYSEVVLYNFTGGSDGGFPVAGVIVDGQGNLYGTTTCGGSSACSGGVGGNGVVFELSASGYHVLYTFTGSSDGGFPAASLTFDNSGNLYGTTEAGGVGACSGGCGVVFELFLNGGYHTEAVLHRFTGGTDGGVPMAPVIFNAPKTILYGTTYAGGGCTGVSGGCGVVYQLKTTGALKVLHRFSGLGDGGQPKAPLVFDGTGTILYGTATTGGRANCPNGCGVAFRLSGTLLTTFHLMHSFAGADGADPTGGLALDSVTSYLFGTTFTGGSSNLGVVFELQQSGTYTLLHSFTGGTGDGANPFAGLVLGDGPLGFPLPTKGGCPPGCGGTLLGGPSNVGVAFGAGP